MIYVVVVVQGKPVPKGRPRFTQTDRQGRTLERPRTYTPAKTEAAEEVFRLRAREQNPGMVPTSELVSVDVKFFGATRGDLDNFVKLVLDASNGVIWVDDRQVRHIEAEMFCDAKEPNPRTVLVVESDEVARD